MIFRIPKGHHRARPIRFGIWWSRNSFSWVVKFTESCRYDLGNEDQGDTNKLCGIGYLPGHHTDSARFGWVYDREIDRIVLHAYCYVDGRRLISSICSCEIGKEYRIRLQVLATAYYFDVYEPISVKAAGMITVPHFHHKKFKYRLGVYFGGNARAPHDMEIDLTKV